MRAIALAPRSVLTDHFDRRVCSTREARDANAHSSNDHVRGDGLGRRGSPAVGVVWNHRAGLRRHQSRGAWRDGHGHQRRHRRAARGRDRRGRPLFHPRPAGRDVSRPRRADRISNLRNRQPGVAQRRDGALGPDADDLHARRKRRRAGRSAAAVQRQRDGRRDHHREDARDPAGDRANVAEHCHSTAPGVTGRSFQQKTQDGRRDQFITVEGGRDSSTNYAIDGVYVPPLRSGSTTCR